MNVLPSRSGGAAAVLATLALAAPAAANVPLTRVSADPFTNTTSQHATEVEPDTFAAGTTLIGAFQVGRFSDGGASDIGYAVSQNGGSKWNAPGFLPGLTFNAGDPTSPNERVSDASVAYDAAHSTWLISSLPVPSASAKVPTIYVSRSTDGGGTWSSPATIPPPAVNKVDLDKNWTVCDSHPASPYYGHCYTELDDYGELDLELMSTSTDGGRTWSTPIPTSSNDHGLGGQPLVQPDGTVIVPFQSNTNKQEAFRSTDGGESWKSAVTISAISAAAEPGLRSSALPSAEIDGAGRVYVAWQDCRFRTKCATNDIVLSSSADGVDWSPASRVPIDPVTSGSDHFIPGLAVDPATSGGGGHLALAYYEYRNAACGTSCQLTVAYISSPDGGSHWGAATQLAGPFPLAEIASTTQGRMVGDYISTSFNGSGLAVPMFAVAQPPAPPAAFAEAMDVPRDPLPVASPAVATATAKSSGVQSAGGATQRAARVVIRSN